MTEDHTDEKTDVASARVVVVGGGYLPGHRGITAG